MDQEDQETHLLLIQHKELMVELVVDNQQLVVEVVERLQQGAQPQLEDVVELEPQQILQDLL